jgi:hypothetical protein
MFIKTCKGMRARAGAINFITTERARDNGKPHIDYVAHMGENIRFTIRSLPEPKPGEPTPDDILDAIAGEIEESAAKDPMSTVGIREKLEELVETNKQLHTLVYDLMQLLRARLS